jgi:RimJ/RimL family protein N-acetyltransferase
MKKTIETERLYLREFTMADAQLLMDLNSDPEVIRYTGDGHVENIAEAEKIISDIILPQYKNKMGRWAVHLKSNDEFIGWCGLKYIEELDEIDLGYRYFRKYWNQGYGSEAALACMKYGWETLQLKKIVGRAALENINSRRILEKVGMKFTGNIFEHGDEVAKYIITSE